LDSVDDTRVHLGRVGYLGNMDMLGSWGLAVLHKFP